MRRCKKLWHSVTQPSLGPLSKSSVSCRRTVLSLPQKAEIMLQRRVCARVSAAADSSLRGQTLAASLVRSGLFTQHETRNFARSNTMQKRFFLRETSLFKFEGLHVSHATKPLPASMGDPHKHPMIVLIGWLGADLKHLKKYVGWYNERGPFASLQHYLDRKICKLNFFIPFSA